MRLALISLTCAACASTDPGGPALSPPTVEFVRRGVVLSPTNGDPLGELPPGAHVLTDGRALVDLAWAAGETVTVGAATAVAPRMASCGPLFSVDLGDVSRLIAMGGSAPDTAMSWSPDGARLAIGSHLGELVIVDGWTGAVRAREKLAETMVKNLAWSADGGTLYAAEQSPDANLYALDPTTLEPRWALRLADRVETSVPPPGDDLFGVYSLPAAYGLTVLPDGDLLVSAAHGWPTDGGRRNRSQVLRISASGEVTGAWPTEPADARLLHPYVDVAGGLIAVPLGRSADGPPPADLPINGVQVLKLDDLSPVAAFVEQPLAPWFTHTFLWEAVSVDAAQDAVLMGFGDGRVIVRGLDGRARVSLSTGAPVMAGEVPIAASVGHGMLLDGAVIFTTSGTNIPWGAAAPDLRPPTAHPRANALWAHDLSGTLLWTWSGDHRVSGVSASPSQDELVVGAGARDSDQRADLFGALVFDATTPTDGRSGKARLSATCPTEGPVFFRQAPQDDGRVAVAENPWVDGKGDVRGAYQVTVLR